MPEAPGAGRAVPQASVESRASWIVAVTVLFVIAIAYGGPLIAVVGLRQIAEELGGVRSVPGLAFSLAWLGSAVGGIAMGRIAERIGVRWTVAFGACMIGLGLVISAGGEPWQLWVGHGLFMGLLGNAGINAPLYVYVSCWFDRRRGTALALISSGQYVAGAVWPSVFEQTISAWGWRATMLVFALASALAIVALAMIVLRPPPEAPRAAPGSPTAGPAVGAPVLGLRPNTALVLLSIAGFLCCVPMAMPQGHLIAFCGDLGIPGSRGAAMLSVLLVCAFISRQVWGWVSDRIGGLNTLLAGSVCQAVAMVGFLITQDEVGLFLVSAIFGLGFSGLIPAYVLTVREIFPASEASWRIPVVLLFTGSGMAFGGWLAAVIYDHAGFYGAAFATGIALNLVNAVILAFLVLRQWSRPARLRPATA
ncbi:MAG: MFS transporter [Acetobacteraceae bacterium]|nr:MFS transporter [Acetobacteraceae bacterium]